MSDSNDAAAEMAAEGGGTDTIVQPPPPEPGMAMPATDSGRKGKKEKSPKPPKVKKEKAPKMRAQRGGSSDLFALNPHIPTRDELEREAAAELNAALTPSYDLLHKEMPDAASPDDAQQRIAGTLGRIIVDNDAALPRHPVYSGDTLVYTQLKRHYGMIQPGNSLGSMGGGLRRSESIHRNMTAADELGNLRRR